MKKKEIFFSFFCVFFLDATNTRESLRTHKAKNKKKRGRKGARKKGRKKGFFFDKVSPLCSIISVLSCTLHFFYKGPF